MEKILNLDQITAIFEGEEEAIKEVLSILEETIPEFVEKVKQCISEKDSVQFKFAIHKFKSSCQLVTNSFFIDHIKELEKADYENTDLTERVEKLFDYINLLQKELQVNKLAA